MIYHINGIFNAFLVLGFLSSLVSAYDGRFDRFFPAWSTELSQYRDNCTLDRDAYYSQPASAGGWGLINCMLIHTSEYVKVEMSVVSILFGLLPSTLFLFGPMQDEIALLALRRPVLATLLGISIPSLRLSDSTSPDLESRLNHSVNLTFRPWKLPVPPLWLMAIVSAFEYILAGLAVANTVYQAYQLAFWSIAMSSMAISSGPIPKTYGPFLWVFLTISVYIVNFGAFNLKYKENYKRQKNWRGNWSRLFWNEVTPCMYGEPMWLIRKRETYCQMMLSSLVNGGVVVLLLYSTVLLSSQIFISLGDAVPVLARYLAASVVCRGIMDFELRGMRETRSDTKSCHDQVPLTSSEIGCVTDAQSCADLAY
ncbi:hypothetical protein F4860DRAFT_468054 [Xylaria cubensis]|nr:hypothetical protein F4860DRAFT_468054 [Xylaria cubensis]